MNIIWKIWRELLESSPQKWLVEDFKDLRARDNRMRKLILEWDEGGIAPGELLDQTISIYLPLLDEDSPPDSECMTLPNGDCIADNCKLHGVRIR